MNVLYALLFPACLIVVNYVPIIATLHVISAVRREELELFEISIKFLRSLGERSITLYIEYEVYIFTLFCITMFLHRYHMCVSAIFIS